jgi:hypothetical protein
MSKPLSTRCFEAKGRTLAVEGKRAHTIETCSGAVRLPRRPPGGRGRPVTAEELLRWHIQEFIADQLAQSKPA